MSASECVPYEEYALCRGGTCGVMILIAMIQAPQCPPIEACTDRFMQESHMGALWNASFKVIWHLGGTVALRTEDARRLCGAPFMGASKYVPYE